MLSIHQYLLLHYAGIAGAFIHQYQLITNQLLNPMATISNSRWITLANRGIFTSSPITARNCLSLYAEAGAAMFAVGL